MEGFTTDAKNSMLGSIVGKPVDLTITHLSLHSAEPNESGSNEVTGGDPAYAKVAVDDTDFDTAAGGEIELLADHEFNGPASGNCPYFGAWDDATFLGTGQIAGDQVFNAAGKFILKAGTKLHLNA